MRGRPDRRAGSPPRQPIPREIRSAAASSSGTNRSRAAASTRSAGPQTEMAPLTVPSTPNTGAATEPAPSWRSPSDRRRRCGADLPEPVPQRVDVGHGAGGQRVEPAGQHRLLLRRREERQDAGARAARVQRETAADLDGHLDLLQRSRPGPGRPGRRATRAETVVVSPVSSLQLAQHRHGDGAQVRLAQRRAPRAAAAGPRWYSRAPGRAASRPRWTSVCRIRCTTALRQAELPRHRGHPEAMSGPSGTAGARRPPVPPPRFRRLFRHPHLLHGRPRGVSVERSAYGPSLVPQRTGRNGVDPPRLGLLPVAVMDSNLESFAERLDATPMRGQLLRVAPPSESFRATERSHDERRSRP